MNTEKFELESQKTKELTVKKTNRRGLVYVLIIIIILLLLSGCFLIFTTSTFVVPNFVNLNLGSTANPETNSLDISGTADRVIVRQDSLGQITLLTPQAIAQTSSPTFAGLTLNNFGTGNLEVDNGKLVVKPLTTVGGTVQNQFIAGNNITFENTSTGIVINSSGGGGGGSFVGDNCGNALCFVQNGNAFGTNAVLGTTDNQGLAFITNNTQHMFIAPNGQTSITPSSISPFGYGLTTTVSATDGTGTNATRAIVNIDGTVAIGGSVRGTRSDINYNSNQIVGSNVFGTASFVNINSGGVFQPTAYSGGVFVESGATAARETAFALGASNSGVLTIDATGFEADMGNDGIIQGDSHGFTSLYNGTGTIQGNKIGFFNRFQDSETVLGNKFGIFLQDDGNDTTNGDVYGIWMSALGASTSGKVYSIYATDGIGHFGGGLQIGTTTDTTAGNIRWNGTNFQGYTGLAWIDFGGSGACGGNCFVQGGNAFGAQAVLGTTDANSLQFVTDNTPRVTIGTDGKIVASTDAFTNGGYGLQLTTNLDGNTVTAAGGGGINSVLNITSPINYNARAYAGTLTYSGGVSTAQMFGSSLVTSVASGTLDASVGNTVTMSNSGTITTLLEGYEAQITNNAGASAPHFYGANLRMTNNGTSNTLFEGLVISQINNLNVNRFDGVFALPRNNAGAVVSDTFNSFFADSTNNGDVQGNPNGTSGLFLIQRGTGTTTNLYGIHLEDLSAQTVSGSVYGIAIDPSAVNTVSNQYGISIGQVINGSVNNYGLYLAGVSGGSTNNYSIFSNQGQAQFNNTAADGIDNPGIRSITTASGSTTPGYLNSFYGTVNYDSTAVLPGNVGPTSVLGVVNLNHGTVGYVAGGSFDTNINNDANVSGGYANALFSHLSNHSTNVDSIVRGVEFDTVNYSGAVMNFPDFSEVGMYLGTNNNNGGTVTGSQLGAEIQTVNDGEVGTNQYGLYVRTDTQGHVAGDKYGAYIFSTGNTGTIDGTEYGLFVTGVSQATTANYGVYIAGASGGANSAALFVQSGISVLAPATTAQASLNIRNSGGVDPSSPNSGDLWWNGTNLNFRTGSSTFDLLAGGGGGCGASCFVQNGNAFGTTAVLGTTDSQDLTLMSNNVQALKVNVFGQVGIGATAGGIGGHLQNYNNVGIASNDAPVLNLEAIGSGVGYLAVDHGNGTILGAESNIYLNTNVDFVQGPLLTGATRIFASASSGRVGIDNTNPQAILGIAAANTGSAQINLVSSGGTDPSTPNAGDLWFNGTALNFYDGTTTTNLLLGGGGGGTPAGNDGNVQFNNSGAFGGNDAFQWNNGSNLLTLSADYAGTNGIGQIINDTNGNGAFLDFGQSGWSWGVGMRPGSTDFTVASGLWTGGVGGDVFTITGGGNAAIDTTPTSAFLTLAAATTGSASLNIEDSGATNPSAPNAGDLWFNGTALNFFDGTSTTDLLSGVAGTCTSCFHQGGDAFGSIANLGTTDNNNLALLTNNTAAITILGTNQRVGIGTPTPDTTLNVQGDFGGTASAGLDVRGMGGNGSILVISQDGTGTWGLGMDPGSNTFGIYANRDTGGPGNLALAITNGGDARFYNSVVVQTYLQVSPGGFPAANGDYVSNGDFYASGRALVGPTSFTPVARFSVSGDFTAANGVGMQMVGTNNGGSYFGLAQDIAGASWSLGMDGGDTAFNIIHGLDANNAGGQKYLTIDQGGTTTINGQTNINDILTGGGGGDFSGLNVQQGLNGGGLFWTGNMNGISTTNTNANGATITGNLQGLDISAQNNLTATLDGNIVGGNIKLSNAGAVTGDAIGLLIQDDPTNPTSVSTDNNGYGIKIGDINWGANNNYAIYTGTGVVHFGDTVETTGDVNIGGNCTSANGDTGAGTGCDVAETFSSSQTLQPGDVVKLDTQASAAWKDVTKTTSTSDQVIGVISTNPTLVMGNKPFTSANAYPVGLTGVLPTNVSDENGLIKKGDYITVSNTVGRGMKANPGDSTIGIAMADQKTSFDTINVLISRNNQGVHTASSQSGTQMDATLLGFTQQLSGLLSVQDGTLTLAGIFQADGIKTGSITVTSNRAGNVSIAVGSTSTTTTVSNLKATAKVFLTPLQQVPQGYQYWVEVQDGQFIVHTNQAVVDSDLHFNYLVID